VNYLYRIARENLQLAKQSLEKGDSQETDQYLRHFWKAQRALNLLRELEEREANHG
jgi:hypothetical protein